MSVSVVVPIYNEHENIMPLYLQLINVLRQLDREYEILFIDDGSTDGSDRRLRMLASRDPRVKASIAAEGHLGLGLETDEAFIKELFE